jgi:hypothetical protein
MRPDLFNRRVLAARWSRRLCRNPRLGLCAARREGYKPRNHSQMPIIFAVGGNRPSFDHENGSDRKALRQTAKLMAY